MAEPRRPGRPSVSPDEPPARLHVSLPPRTYDRAQQRAERKGISVPELVRRSLDRELSSDEDE